MGIKKLLVLIMLAFVCLFFISQLAFADNKGYIHITIADAPPRIFSVVVKPEIAYTDSEIFCLADIYDENMSLLQIEYEWHVNNEIIEGNENILQAELHAGDEVSCRIYAVDVYKHINNLTSQAVVIQPRSFLQTTGYAIRNIQDVNSESNGLIGGVVISFGVIVAVGFGFRRLRRLRKF